MAIKEGSQLLHTVGFSRMYKMVTLVKNGLTEKQLGKKEYRRSGVTTSNLEYISQTALFSLLTESFFLLTKF